MIPILYDSNEVNFISNGLGRLRDCTECTVIEERNGVYECDFSYPIDGANYGLIQLGRIIGVTHDETGDIQPFDIESYSRPIDGVVTFHCTHISYRQSKMVTYGTNITSLANAFQVLSSVFYPTEPLGPGTSGNPFTYTSDMAPTGYVAAFDGAPRTIRSILGGSGGSILDAYGGEYEWDRWSVILHSSRGIQRDFSIRYGINMTKFQDDTDYSETYNTCIPFWKSGTSVVRGGQVSSGESGYGAGNQCLPLDLTDKFETQPSAAQLETMAAKVMNENRSYLPKQTISVDFIRIQDEAGFDDFDQLLQCKLCDSIKVIFPRYNMSAYFKIVKTTWNVLLDRYDGMELGNLPTTLAEALGVSNTGGDGASGAVDYIVEQATSGIWTYRKWSSGVAECWGIQSLGTKAITSAYGNGFYASADTINLPSGLFTSVTNVQATSRDTAGYGTWFNVSNISTTAVTGYMYGISSVSTGVTLSLYVVGKWR